MRKFIWAALAIALAACSPAKQETTQTESTGSAATTATALAQATPATTAATTSATETAAPPKPASYYENKVAELHTSAGEIDIRFFPDVAPNHVRNFIDLAEKGFYTGTKFHRTIPNFMIQGGDPNTISGPPETWGVGGTGNTLKAEFNSVKHKRGIVSMARAGDPNSASSQFFIVVAPEYPSLDGEYTAFGQVTKGMSVVDKIVNAPAEQDRPTNPVSINSITIREAKPNEKGPTPK